MNSFRAIETSYTVACIKLENNRILLIISNSNITPSKFLVCYENKQGKYNTEKRRLKK